MSHYTCEGCFNHMSRCTCKKVAHGVKCMWISCICGGGKTEPLKHPMDIPGFLTLTDAATYIESMRYDRLEDFLEELKKALYRRAEADHKDGKYQLSMTLGKASGAVGTAATHVGDAWRICEPYMEDK